VAPHVCVICGDGRDCGLAFSFHGSARAAPVRRVDLKSKRHEVAGEPSLAD